MHHREGKIRGGWTELNSHLRNDETCIIDFGWRRREYTCLNGHEIVFEFDKS
jgi:tRNA A-37 threonylcarbamoyl transferase component Bud32